MKILMVNKFHYIQGGSETYYFALKRKLTEEGHQVVDFSMRDEKNFDSPYSDFFVEHTDYSGKMSPAAKLKAAAGLIYSREAKRKFEQLVLLEKPDLVHLHLFQHQISPSILDICKKYGIPTVYTAHDLKMICLNYKMMHHGRLCEDCRDGRLYHCVANQCVKDSFAKSCICLAEGCLHRWRKTYDAIDTVITPSRFYRDKFIGFGIGSERILHIPNFLDAETPAYNQYDNANGYYLYLGRFSEEKGILTLIRAMKGIPSALYIAGTGPLQEKIESMLRQTGTDSIRLLGFQSGQELTDLVANAKAVILPSEWYENSPYSAIEALRLGKPILGADIGGIPEMVDGNGFLFAPGDVSDLHRVIERFEKTDAATLDAMGRRSKELFAGNYTWEVHRKELYRVYGELLAKTKSTLR